MLLGVLNLFFSLRSVTMLNSSYEASREKNCFVRKWVHLVRNGYTYVKSSFSREVTEIKESQKCNKGNGCKSCGIMNLKKNVTVWKNNDTLRKTVKLDFRRDCLTECAIYMYVCNICVHKMTAFTLAKQLTVVKKE